MGYGCRIPIKNLAVVLICLCSIFGFKKFRFMSCSLWHFFNLMWHWFSGKFFGWVILLGSFFEKGEGHFGYFYTKRYRQRWKSDLGTTLICLCSIFGFKIFKFMSCSLRERRRKLWLFLYKTVPTTMKKWPRDDPKVGPGATTARMRFRGLPCVSDVWDFFWILGHFLETFSDHFLMIFQRRLF